MSAAPAPAPVSACPVRISTITANGDLGTKVDLQTFFDQLEIVPVGQEGIVWAKYAKEVRGTHPDPKKNAARAEPQTKHFNHQVTIVYYYRDKYTPNLKIFYNGNVQMTGVKGFDDGRMFVERIAGELRRIHASGHPEVVTDLEKLGSYDFQIRMINSDYRVPYEIRRKELYNILLQQYDLSCSYQPESYPGVKINYFWNAQSQHTGICQCDKFCMGRVCKKVTISIFRSGSILITGATSYEQVCDAYQFIQKILHTFESQIRWVMPNNTGMGVQVIAPTTTTKVTKSRKPLTHSLPQTELVSVDIL